MKIKVFILLSMVLYGCVFNNETTLSERELYKKSRNKPITEKEKIYVRQLMSKGYDKIDVQPPRIGDDLSGNSSYHIAFNSNLIYNNDNIDSITKINYEIAKELYENVIEDSILFDISEICVTMKIKSSFDNSEKEKYKSVSKKLLENDLNFKVIRKGKDSYERVLIH